MFKHRNLIRCEELPCGELGPDDGVDPRLLARREQRGGGGRRRRDRQLCKQAFQALSLALMQLEGEALEGAAVVLEAVEPFPDASRLKLHVAIEADGPTDVAGVLGQLRRRAGWLRCELARALHRKRVPSLVIDLAPPRG